MDGVTWAKEGLVDWLVPCPFWSSMDFDIPVELWKERIGEAKVIITPGAEFNSRPWPGGKPVRNDVAALAGFAASAWQRGADGIYLFNWMDSGTRPVSESSYHDLMQRGLAPDVVVAQLRRVPVCYRDTVPQASRATSPCPSPARTAARAGWTLARHQRQARHS